MQRSPSGDHWVVPSPVRQDATSFIPVSGPVSIPPAKRTASIKEARKIRVRIQEKFTVPMACLVFGLFGATLGAQPTYRTSRSFSFVLTLGIIAVYYVIGFSFSSLGVKGTLPPVLAAWLPVMLFLGAGGLLLKQASR